MPRNLSGLVNKIKDKITTQFFGKCGKVQVFVNNTQKSQLLFKNKLKAHQIWGMLLYSECVVLMFDF